jgi:hypothetical protein
MFWDEERDLLVHPHSDGLRLGEQVATRISSSGGSSATVKPQPKREMSVRCR